MKFGLYENHGYELQIRCVDGEFTYIDPKCYSEYAPGTEERWDAILSASGELVSEYDFFMLKFSGSLCTHTRAVAKSVYGVPDDVELYTHGDFNIDRVPELARTEQLNLRISPELKAKLQEVAEREGKTIGSFIEHLIKEAVFNNSGDSTV